MMGRARSVSRDRCCLNASSNCMSPDAIARGEGTPQDDVGLW